MTCPRCGHAADLHRHIRDGGCMGRKRFSNVAARGFTVTTVRCSCTRNPDATAGDLDDPSEDVLERGVARDAELRREDPLG